MVQIRSSPGLGSEVVQSPCSFQMFVPACMVLPEQVPAMLDVAGGLLQVADDIRRVELSCQHIHMGAAVDALTSKRSSGRPRETIQS